MERELSRPESYDLEDDGHSGNGQKKRSGCPELKRPSLRSNHVTKKNRKKPLIVHIQHAHRHKTLTKTDR
jgi:hypothetical protein